LVKDRGFEFWYQLFAAEVNPAINPDLPTLRPWKIVTKPITTTATAQRNPYYWKVDPEGRQLPYVDEIFWNIIQSVEMIPVRILSGKVDMQAQYVSFGDYSLLMEGREKGEYRVNIWDYGESGSAMHVNQSRQGDDEMAELLRNRDFRIALSKAIRRDEVNELFYAGLAASNLELYPESVKSDPEIQALFEYDLDEANALLDGLGLDKRNDDGIRLLPSGRPLRFVHMTSNNYAIHIDTGQILVNFLRELGIDAVTEIEPGETWWDRMPRNDWDSIGYVVDYTNGNLYWLNYPRSYFPVETSTYWATGWGYYYQTDGREGTEPVGEDARRLVDIWNEINVTIDMDRRKELMDEVFYICAYNLWPITVVGGGLVPCVVKNDFRNVPESATLAWPIYSPRPWNPEHFFHKQA
jgi:peptide/nickel transport system substrate-binding protein